MKRVFVCIFLFHINISIAQISDFSHVDFSQADNIAKLNEGENLSNLAALTYKLTHKLSTDVEKFRAIYTWGLQQYSR